MASGGRPSVSPVAPADNAFGVSAKLWDLIGPCPNPKEGSGLGDWSAERRLMLESIGPTLAERALCCDTMQYSISTARDMYASHGLMGSKSAA